MDLILKMLSIPPEIPLTCTQRFTYISAFVAYFVGGLSTFLVPGVWSALLDLDFSTGGRGYFFFFGSSLVVIGICYVILARNKASQVPNQGPLLGTIVNRIVLIDGFAILFYIQGIINVRFALMFSILDSTLSIITYVIWSREEKDASLMKFFQDFWSVVNPCSQKPPSYAIFQALGFVQFIVGLVAPSILLVCGIVPSGIEGTYVEGLLRSHFVLAAINGLLHVYAAGSQNDSFPIGSVFYRMIWNVPVLLLLGLTSQIPLRLAVCLVIYDVLFSGITINLFAKEYRSKSN